MAGYGKNSRAGKRGPSSSSSSSSWYVSTTMMVLLVCFCLYGVYMFTSSSITPPHSASSNKPTSHKRTAVSFPSRQAPRTVLREPPPASDDDAAEHAHDDTQANLPEDAVRGDQEQEKVTSTSAGTEEDSQSEVEGFQHEKRQQEEEVETHREEFKQLQAHHQQQEQQQLQQQQEEVQSETGGNIEGRQAEEEIGNIGSQQHGQNTQVIQQVTDGSHSHSEDDGEVGITSQSQMEHDADGTTDQEHHHDHHGITSQSQIEHDSEGTTEEHQHHHQQEEGTAEEHQHRGTAEEHQLHHQKDGTTEEHQHHLQQEEQERHEQRQREQLEREQQRQQQEEEQQQQQQHQQDEQQQQQQHKQEEEQQQQQPQQQQQVEQQQEPTQPQHTEEESAALDGGANENKQQNEDNTNTNDSLPEGAQSAVPIENESSKSSWKTQADHSLNEKERRKENEPSQPNEGQGGGGGENGDKYSGSEWELCNVTAGPDYIPCLDNEKAIKLLRTSGHFEHRERHCPEESPTCLVPLPKGYKRSIGWPESRDRIWYNNVPHTKLAEVKGHQNWVKVAGEYLTFPGGGTQFIHGALHYIDFIQESVPEIAWGKRTRVILDVGCGVASFGGYLFERDVLALSFAPKDEHEAQVQFALERGIPAISAVMGSQRLPFPGRVFDIVHCARCRVPWHANDGALLLELNRVLRPGGFFVWSATPVYQKLQEDVEIWEAMTALTKSMCWDLITIKKDKLNSVGAAIYRKPVTNDCYEQRQDPKPPMCKEDDDPNAAWYVPLESCMHRVPENPSERGTQWPQEWPQRVQVAPYWLNNSQIGVYGRPAPEDFTKDNRHWKRVFNKSYLTGMGIDWSKVRNVMDMRAVYGGFAAALKDTKVWVMNLVNIDAPDTLPIIYERGLFGMYHDWCESFSTYPRTYDLLHADRLFSQLKKRCKILPVIAEVDRIVRPGGKLIVRDEPEIVSEVENMLKSLHWEIRLTYSKNEEGLLCAEKSEWRPETYSSVSL